MQDDSPFLRDATLVRRVLRGDHEAFDELVKPCAAMIYASALSILRNEADAEEVSQESLLKALKNLSDFRGESRFSTWVVKIAVNEALLLLRKYRAHAYDSFDAPVRRNDGKYVPCELPDRRETPFGALERKELRQALFVALDSLPRRYRDVLILRDLRNQTTRQTALALGVTEASVRSSLFRARLKIRHTLGSQINPGNLESERSYQGWAITERRSAT